MSKKGKKQVIPADAIPKTYQDDMAQRGTIFIDGEDVDLNQVAKVPQILKNQGTLIKKHMSVIQKQRIIDKIRTTDPSITQKEATVGLLDLTNKTMNRQAYDQYFGEDLRSEFLENAMMLNNEEKLVTEKFIENSQRYEYNPNTKFAEPSMQLERFSPGLSPEQINNEIMYSGSNKQKEKENQRKNDIYGIQTQSDLGQSSSFEDQPPIMPLMQEKLIEKQQQAIEKDLVSQENLAQIYDIGSLDWG
ncbi:MAG: hypothetical protein EZS28_001073 [Streblomastix strix]|uniref:Uncharacterized protein n=1 Tax=Streblomastix strix TaxID=222440 RepID=A0A5J4X826_9EUKA|nr:MAG: hypothetical protein EZS28_001073 [Streblomastix strix]